MKWKIQWNYVLFWLLLSKMNSWRSCELIGCVDLIIFREIWSEHSLLGKEQKGVFYFKYSFRDGLHRSTLREFFDSGTWQSYEKITNRNKSKNADSLLDIDALLLTLHSSFASTITFHTRLVQWNVNRLFWSRWLLPPLESKSQNIFNPSKCKELVLRKKNNNTQYDQICNMLQCNRLSLLCATHKVSEHIRQKLAKANRCLLVLRSLRKEQYSQVEILIIYDLSP